jgi:O-methyltransferase
LTQRRDFTPEELYLELLKGILTRRIVREKLVPLPMIGTRCRIAGILLRLIRAVTATPGVRLGIDYDESKRRLGLDWPADAETMVGKERLDNLQKCVCQTLNDNIPGDLIETGVWRGGCTILMRAILKAYHVTDKRVWVADSFQGLPRPDPGKYVDDAGDPHWQRKELAVGIEEVRANFARYGLLDDQVRFLHGWFRDTLPSAPVSALSVVRLDGDMYESTMDGLTNLYPKLSPGGYLIVDDYGAIEGCRKAVEDYRRANGILEPIQSIDWTGAFWRREQ